MSTVWANYLPTIPQNINKAISYLDRAAEDGNPFTQYALGKVYLLGKDVPRDEKRGIEYLQRAADLGIRAAQYFLEHRDEQTALHVGSAVVRMLHHMGNIFREQSADSLQRGIHVDRKRQSELKAKRMALGHRVDDHEDELDNKYQQTM